MARTCRTFHEPAVDPLWRCAALANLFLCMPSDLRAVDETGDWITPYKMRFLRPIRTTDWQRFLRYAPRVRPLFTEYDEWSLSEVLPALSLCLPENAFNHLQGLNWMHSDKDFHYIRAFLRPTLSTISCYSSSHCAMSLFSILASKCPELKDISFESTCYLGDSNIGPEAQAVSSTVCESQLLEVVSVHILDQQALEHVSRLPNLTALHVNALPVSLSIPPASDTRPFPALRTLHLVYPEIQPAIRFLLMCRDLLLASFTATFPEPITRIEADDFYTALVAACAHKSVTNIHVDSDADYWNLLDPSQYLVSSRSLRMLLCLVNLTSIYIKCDAGFELDDDIASDLARAWPRIQTLKFVVDIPSSQPPPVTIACLSPFYVR
ncbi:hypothetical protein DFH07DRAFT_780328 [Mycena maculata]|uniref:F-box domain-containing protein n=1 Tax=Mycena maculata TaxID=230809 RepID=A0AAD7MV42_9AGAR|nr:hypothetical protein DFH07DRAFT_780328 [Mycena maculata]